MPLHFGPWDVVLVVAVSLQATALAYIPSPRWKAFAFCLPFPFTFASLALGHRIDTTNVLGLPLLIAYTQGVRLLHRRLGLPIVVAIAISALGYSLVGCLLAPVVPLGDAAFWLALAGALALGIGLYRWLPDHAEPGHRTSLPVYIKLPIVATVVIALVVAKGALHGFMTLFPMVGVVAAYESRHSLWTWGRQMPTWMIAMVPMMAILRLAEPLMGIAPALLLGWLGFLATLLPLTWRQWTRDALEEKSRLRQAALPQHGA